ncbi:uncharacterized protein TNCV_2158191 [Trichonephila clavipes]|nr:uncharacterized protein TNCV_2158191 [Trichonephila clavipes]
MTPRQTCLETSRTAWGSCLYYRTQHSPTTEHCDLGCQFFDCWTPLIVISEALRVRGYRTVACFITGSSPVPLKFRRVGQRRTLNLSRAETSSRWCGVVVRRGGASSGVVHVT